MPYRTQLQDLKSLISTIDLSIGYQIKQTTDDVSSILTSACPPGVSYEQFSIARYGYTQQYGKTLKDQLIEFHSSVQTVMDIVNRIKSECAAMKQTLSNQCVSQDINAVPTMAKKLSTYHNRIRSDIQTMDLTLNPARDAISAKLVESFSTTSTT